MRQSFAFRRSLRFIALALCSVSIVAFVSPASARPHHGAGRHARAHHAKHHYSYRHHRHAIRMSRGDRNAPPMQAGGFAVTNPSFMESSPQMVAPGGFGSSNVAAEARACICATPRSQRDVCSTCRSRARRLRSARASVTTLGEPKPPDATIWGLLSMKLGLVSAKPPACICGALRRW